MIELGILSQKLGSGFPVQLDDSENDLTVLSCDILAVKREREEIALCVLQNGLKKAFLSFTDLKAVLSRTGNFQHTGRDLVVNLDRVKEIKPVDSDEYYLITEYGHKFPVTPFYAEKIRAFYGFETLQHVMPFSKVYYWMSRLGIKQIEKNILYMTREELFNEFAGLSGEVIVSVLIVNFLWQQICYIRQGKESPVEGGNVRSLWYLIKPVIYKIQPKPVRGVDHYKTLSEKISLMVANKLFSYSEFGLYEDGKWSVGKKVPHVILMAEKDSHYNFLLKMQEELGCSIVSSGGQPKTISSEYFSKEFKKKVPGYYKKGKVKLIALVDYDPFGFLLLDTLVNDLRVFGIKGIKVSNLSLPKNYTPDELEYLHYDLIYEGEVTQTILKKWMRKTHGINGNPWGMEVDVMMMDKKRVRELILREMK